MIYACAIHECRTAKERHRAADVMAELSLKPCPDPETFQERLRRTLRSHGLLDAELQPLATNSRVDVVVNGRTIMSWTQN